MLGILLELMKVMFVLLHLIWKTLDTMKKSFMKPKKIARSEEKMRVRDHIIPELSLNKWMCLLIFPVLKHHDMAGVSGCLKNMAFGSVDNTRRFHGKPLYCNPAIGEIFENKVLKDKVVLNIVDGLVASYDKGPTYHEESTWKYGGLFVSPDPVILDVLILQTVNQKREEMGLASMSKFANHITAASGLGLGNNSLDQVNLQKIEV